MRSVLARPAVEVAPALLGATLRSASPDGVVAVRLTEVEAYEGVGDPASHAGRGPTPRSAIMFGRPGVLYVYFTYGMHWCANVVCQPDGIAGAVLLRAGDVVEGADLARLRRPAARSGRDLARGPARLAAALGLTDANNGADLTDPSAPVTLHLGVPPATVATGPRVGITRAADVPWRFWDPDAASVSAFRPGVRRPRG